MNTYFMADPHFNHDGVIEMSNRPFRNVEEMNDVIMEGINLTVGRDDRLYILGDFAWYNESSLFNQIKCRNVHLVIGNHDRGRAIRLFKTVDDVVELKFDIGTDRRQIVFLSHYPHCFWPASHYGSYHLYGHIHGQREDWLNEKLGYGRRSMDVGVDEAWRIYGVYRPFSWAEIHQTLRNRTGHDNVEWYRQRQAQQRDDLNGEGPKSYWNQVVHNNLQRYREYKNV